jgi:hypothetical protein
MSILFLIIILAITQSANALIIVKSSDYNKEILSHDVLVEYATLTTCPHCPTASLQLNDIYSSGDYDFYYVSLVYDQNENLTWGRLEELGATVVPDVFFDGNFQHVVGKQSDDQVYRNAIENCGMRDVFDVNINVEVSWLGNGMLKIIIDVQNNESIRFDGRLRVYVVEPDSRWSDSNGIPYRFGFLSFAFDRKLSLVKKDIKNLGETYTYTSIWIGGLYGFKDISIDNIMVIAAIFDEENDYVQQTAAAVPEYLEYGKQDNINNLINLIIERHPNLLFLLTNNLS